MAVRGSEAPQVTPELRQKAVGVLQQNLDRPERSSCVAAAEYLLSLGYPANVEAKFRGESEQAGKDSALLVDSWSVLARAAAGDQRLPWIEKLLGVALDTNAAEQTAAARSLGEMGDALADENLAKLQEGAKSANGPWRVYLEWIRLNSSCEDAEAQLAGFLASEDPAVREAAAYALRHRGKVLEATQQAIQSAAQREPTNSPVRVGLVAAAAVHATGDAQKTLRQELIQFASSGNDAQRFQAFHALARIATPDDLPLLVGGLEDTHVDAQSAAAWATLRVGRRVSHQLVGIDWCVIAAYIFGMLAIGWYYSHRNVSTEDYLLGGREMKPLNVGLSLFAGLMSVISYLAWPGEIIKYGPMMLCIYFAHPLTYLVVGWLLIPFIMKLKVTSAYEILETRLGLGVRMLGSFFFLSLRLGWMAVIVYAASSKVLVPLMGLPQWSMPLLCAALGLITVAYTSMGGIRAVVLTDVIQTAILFLGAIVAIIVITVQMGGVAAWWPTGWAPHWPEPIWTYSSAARVTAFGAAFSTFVWWVCTSGSDQMAIQRYLSTRDAKAARGVMAVTLISDFVVGMFLAALGLALLGYFRFNPQLLPDGQSMIQDADQLFPRFIGIGLPAGLSGLVVAGLLAASMSALSAGMNSSCSVITVDLIDRFRRNKERQIDEVKRAKYVSLAVGLIVVFLSTFVGMVHGNLLEVCYKVVNLLTAPLFGLFFMAMFVRWSTGFGTIVGAVAGLVVVVAVNYWQEITGVKGISFLWAMPLALAAQVIVGALVSLLPIGRRAPLLVESPSVETSYE
jgi:SSS family solute:Na+ symporter